MTTPTKTRIPNPIYAAAGAADFAYEKLRDLQAKVAEQRPVARELDIERLRGVARRNAKAFVSGAQAAQERVVASAQVAQERVVARAHDAQEKAVAFYTDLVSRGEKVVRSRARTAEGTAGEIADTAAADAKRTRRAVAATGTGAPAGKSATNGTAAPAGKAKAAPASHSTTSHNTSSSK